MMTRGARQWPDLTDVEVRRKQFCEGTWLDVLAELEHGGRPENDGILQMHARLSVLLAMNVDVGPYGGVARMPQPDPFVDGGRSLVHHDTVRAELFGLQYQDGFESG